ncbi:helix-turn-helix domain-containing protein [Sphingomonas fuzhouensis]|uniref:helix-turn-helix domain-containing protein n=1 Tax=Sphingomonas fuzhouensis TaxID=3106033 RepID=UPI002AFF5976|nr:helix-turn-helix domain-containing protein [Sphingomonas sp. SGZ-02]
MSYKRIRSLERGVAILQHLNHVGSATAGEISRDTGLPRPTVYRILDTLLEGGLIYRSPSAHKVYRLTEAVDKLSLRSGSVEPLTAAARRVLETLPDSVPWPVFLSTCSRDGVVIRETTRGSSIFWTELGWVGAEAPIWEVAPGRAHVAFAAPAERATLLADHQGDPSEAIQTIRERGYAEERDKDSRLIGLSVPIGRGLGLIGCLSIMWQVGSDTEERLVQRYLPMLERMAKAIKADIRVEEDLVDPVGITAPS